MQPILKAGIFCWTT